MGSVAPPRPPQRPMPLPAGDERALLDQAQALRRAAAVGRLQPLLRGKNLGLLCRDDGTPSGLLFRDAAAALGAHVAHIESSRLERSSPQELEHGARMLGRLYDAVECQGLDAGLVRQLSALSGHHGVQRPGGRRDPDRAPGPAAGLTARRPNTADSPCRRCCCRR